MVSAKLWVACSIYRTYMYHLCHYSFQIFCLSAFMVLCNCPVKTEQCGSKTWNVLEMRNVHLYLVIMTIYCYYYFLNLYQLTGNLVSVKALAILIHARGINLGPDYFPPQFSLFASPNIWILFAIHIWYMSCWCWTFIFVSGRKWE